MISQFQFLGELKIDAYKVITCAVQLNVDVQDDQSIATDYVDGLKVSGELYFDSFPLNSRDRHPVKPNALGQLTLLSGSETTKVKIVIIEKNSEIELIPRQSKRYFWHFFVVGKPAWDQLEIFPENYRGFNANRIYTCTNFRGNWPVSVSSLIIASNKTEAKKLLLNKLKCEKIEIEDENALVFEEFNINDKKAIILNNGDWQ